MKINKIGLCGLIGLFVLIIAASGCTSFNQVQNKTFSNGGITFQYPGTWADNITFNYANAPTSNHTVIGTMGDNTTKLSVYYLDLKEPIFSGFTIESLIQLAHSQETGGTERLTTNTSTSNNITFYEEIYTSKDGVSGEIYKNYRVLFGKNGDKLYFMLFKTKEADFQKSYQQMKEIQSSVKYT